MAEVKRIELNAEEDINVNLRNLKYSKELRRALGLFLINEENNHSGQEIDVYHYKEGATMVSYTYSGGMNPMLIIGGKTSAVDGLVSLVEQKWGSFTKREI